MSCHAILAFPLALVAVQPYDSSIRPLPAPLEANLEARFWQPGLPRAAVAPAAPHRLPLGLRRPRAHGPARREPRRRRPARQGVPAALRAALPDPAHAARDTYGPRRAYPDDGDVSGSFQCRRGGPVAVHGRHAAAAAGRTTPTAHAIDLNPVENPYVGCGRVHDPASAPYVDRSRLRKGMVTPAVVGRSARSAGAGAATGPARRRTTCTSRRPGTSDRGSQQVGRRCSDMSKNQVERPRHPGEIKCLDEQTRVTDLPPAAAAHEAPELLLVSVLATQAASGGCGRIQALPGRRRPFHGRGTESADQLVLQVCDAHVETECSISARVRSEPRPARSSPRRKSPSSAASQRPASLRSSPCGPNRFRNLPMA